ncbi:MAG: peptidase M15, partial [Alphaproteobacteria bacterium]
MLRNGTGAPRGLRLGVCGFTASLFILASDAAGAAPYADFVLDANSGNVLHETNADARRHPASLTKIMTLYLLFEQLQAGKLKLDSQMNVSKEAASQSPTKLGLKPGSTLAVEDAIKGMVTRSANDAAVVVAEAIAGDEDDFAKLMTRKAHALGMSRTVYKNASGLPNDDQVTTARDQATLGRAIQERFPRYYKYFSTRSFNFRGQSIGNHNHLLGRVEGVDGIKTGYISASGFNLVTSVHRGNRYLVAVVMGGSSAGSRDSRMRELINDKIARAATQRTTAVIAEASQPSEDKAEPKLVGRSEAKPDVKAEAKSDANSEAKTERKSQAKRLAKAEAKTESKPQTNIAESKPDQTAEPTAEPRFAVASATSVPASLNRSPALTEPAATRSATAASVAQTVIGSTEPIRPVLVRTLTVRAGTPTAPVAPALQVSSPPQPAEPAEVPAWPPATIVTPDPAPAPRPTTTSPGRAGTADQAPTAPPAATIPVAPAPAPAPTPVAAAVPTPAPITPAAVSAPTPPPAAAPAVAAPAPERSVPLQSTPRQAAVAPAPKPQARSGWIIQVGAYHAEEEAKQRLSTVRSKASKMLTGADPFTET